MDPAFAAARTVRAPWLHRAVAGQRGGHAPDPRVAGLRHRLRARTNLRLDAWIPARTLLLITPGVSAPLITLEAIPQWARPRRGGDVVVGDETISSPARSCRPRSCPPRPSPPRRGRLTAGTFRLRPPPPLPLPPVWVRDVVARTPLVRKLLRYSAASVVGVTIGQSALYIFYEVLDWPAVLANLAAVTISSVPAYLINRYWVWEKTDSNSLRREVLPFWGMALLGLLLSTLLVAFADDRTDSPLIIAIANLAGFGVLWLAKFFILDRVLFAVPTRRSRRGARAQRDGLEVPPAEELLQATQTGVDRTEGA